VERAFLSPFVTVVEPPSCETHDVHDRFTGTDEGDGLAPAIAGSHTTMTNARHDEHLDAEEDDGSAELQPEDGGTAPTPNDEAAQTRPSDPQR
jgi:hypothetical protein